MAKFKVEAEIYVEGADIKSKNDVTDLLCVMLGCFDDMDDSDASITIHMTKTEKI